ncbi:CAP domain-containing protein [Peribacillus sp. SCS-155]|uniref:CAP domain-containing protein n=1 Tax=Peribacillus sedimenti TaxID=3115297 RepID=UPI003905BA90
MKKAIAAAVLTLTLLFPGAALGATTYKVISGDTMWKIAAKNQVSYTALVKANPQISNPNIIQVGQFINIPTNTTQTQSLTSQVVSLVNKERAKVGLPDLKADTQLAVVAKAKSEEMRDKNYFDHNSPTYGSPFEMMTSFGINYKYAGENIAAGQVTAQEVMTSWMQSPGHKANILSKNYTYIGVGYAKGGSYGYYWTQQFISK